MKASYLKFFPLIFCLILSSCTTPREVEVIPSQTPEAQIVESSVVPSPTTENQRRSVFVISWDGAPANVVYKLMAEGTLPHFSALASKGVRAEYARSVDPTLTVPAHNSISTGVYPNHHGLIANAFHNASDSFYWYRSAYDEPLNGGEPVWVTASHAGLKTAVLFFPGCSPKYPAQSADYTIGYGVRDSYSNQVTISFAPLSDSWSGESPPSFSPPLEGSFTIRKVARIYLYALDSSDDMTPNYDTVILNTSRQFNTTMIQLKIGEWGQLVLIPATVAGADFLLQEIVPGEEGLEITLYHGGVYHNIATPRELLEELNSRFNYFPAGHDYYALEHGWITPEDDLHLIERGSRWMAEVTAWVKGSYQPDLLFTWQDVFDAAGHSFTMQTEQQYNFSPNDARQHAEYFRQAAEIADRALSIMLSDIDLKTTTVMMLSDHGMAPLHTTVYVNTLLEQAGLLTLDSRDYVVVKKSKALAVASSGAVNIYINLQGHEKDGIVLADEYDSVQAQIIELLESLTDPQSGAPVFQRVLRQNELEALHLDHPNSGDIFAQANPGYHLNGYRGKSEVFEPATFYGQHGYDSNLPDMYAIFIAAGSGVPPTGEIIPPIQIVDYAPTIAFLLGISPSPLIDGKPIPTLMGSK